MENMAYLVTIMEAAPTMMGVTGYAVLIPDTKSLGKLANEIDEEHYIIYKIERIGIVKDYKELMENIKKQNKPDDLNFGKDKDSTNDNSL